MSMIKNEIITLLNSGQLKSGQYGTVDIDFKEKKIAIKPVDVNKSIIKIEGNNIDKVRVSFEPTESGLSSTSIILTTNEPRIENVSWGVIELK